MRKRFCAIPSLASASELMHACSQALAHACMARQKVAGQLQAAKKTWTVQRITEQSGDVRGCAVILSYVKGADSPPTRCLHFTFGLPLDSRTAGDVLAILPPEFGNKRSLWKGLAWEGGRWNAQTPRPLASIAVVAMWGTCFDVSVIISLY